jgi:hypothetical protein
MTQSNQSSLDNILDATLDDLADMPSIQLFPNGAHKATVSFKYDEKKATVQIQLTYIEPLELSDPTANPPAAGDKNSVFFFLKKKDGSANEYAQGGLKNILTSLKSLGGSTSKEVMEAAEGAEVAVVTKIRVGKGEYEGRDNLDIVKIEVM